MPRLNLADSLALVVLIAEQRPALAERAAVRLAGRFLLEHPRATLSDGLLVLALLADVREHGNGTAAARLREFVAAHY
jgi:hypothetical protein